MTDEQEREIASIDWKIDRLMRELNQLVEQNNVLEADLAPRLEKLKQGREKEDDIRGELYSLSNQKMKMGWKSNEQASA